LSAVGNPTYPGAGITWTSFSGSTPASAFWVATQYTINGTKTPWRIVPVRTKQADLGLIIHTISGRNKPTMNDSVWKADAITAISTFTGNTYSTTNEMGFGTVIGITYDNGKLFGMLKKVSGVATWVTTSTFIDGELLVTETVVTDKIAANAVTGTKISSTTTITAGSGNNVGVLDGADGTYRIYAGHATPASAPFRVKQDGTVIIESASSGSRLVIDDDKIKVFDGSTLRVQLGNLA